MAPPSDADVATFQSVTGCGDAAEARQLLEACKGDLNRATELFFAQAEGDLPGEDAPMPDPAPPPQQPARPAAAAKRAKPAGGVMGLGDLGGSDSDEDGAGGNEYYAGGAKSGTAVRGRSRGDDDEDRVGSLFDRARAQGAREGRAEDLPGHRGPARGFQGTGRRLDGSNPDPNPAAAAGGARALGPVKHTITFYQDMKFTVNDGPARDVMDPANRAFMQAIGEGVCPQELEGDGSRPVEVNLVRKHEDYKEPPKPKYLAFQGKANKLTADTDDTAADPPPESSSAAAAQPAPAPAIEVDTGAPLTSVQIRLHDGTRMVCQFNHTSTVQDIRTFISRSRPDMPASYQLIDQTGFPPKPLTDAAATLEQAGLINGVLSQKL